ncbi:hypothetical protein TcCL_Unassigned01539 [Trypanosoma cruzi]|nr:hypothetical protein TcCL_Unassigned01539 [Trypanosoma cruzi]
MVVAPLPRGACGLWLLWTERMMRGKRDAVRSSSISVGGYTSHAIPSDRLQQRPSPSAAVGEFPLPLERNSTDVAARPLPHQHNEGATAKDETRTARTQS